MADPKEEEKIENKVEESGSPKTGSPKKDSELSDADLKKVAGGKHVLPSFN